MKEKAASGVQQDTVLVVGDDVLVRVAVAEYLRHCGYRVIEAATVTEAKTVLEKKNIWVDVVFADLQSSSSQETFGLSQWIRQERPGIEVILAGGIRRVAKAAAEVCEDGPLERPFEPQTLVDRIRRLKAARERS